MININYERIFYVFTDVVRTIGRKSHFFIAYLAILSDENKPVEILSRNFVW